jgi:hypothetical protein
MKRIKVWLLLTVGCITGLSTTFGQQSKELVGMQVLYDPKVVMIDGWLTVYYELKLTNNSKDSLVLQKLDILTEDKVLVESMSGDELSKRFSRDISQAGTAVLPPHETGLVYIEADLHIVPAGLNHRLTYTTIHPKKEKTATAYGGSVGHLPLTPVLIGAPLSGGAWAAVYDPSWKRGHRRVVYAVDGKERIPGRFAIDFILLDSSGRYAAGAEDSIKNWFGYGAAVKAVANGVVASVRDDFPESPTLSGHPAYAADKATGNYISIDMGNGYFAFYEHLKPGSIRVKPGQRVNQGDVIAALGFTGQTTGPHLHFHIANANSPLGAEGVPFEFIQFYQLGAYPDFGQFGKMPWTPVQRTEIIKQRPGPNTVVSFVP